MTSRHYTLYNDDIWLQYYRYAVKHQSINHNSQQQISKTTIVLYTQLNVVMSQELNGYCT